MADLEFRQALRRWQTENTQEAQERVIYLAFRQGMDIWDIFRFILNNEENIPLHQAIQEALADAERGLGPTIERALDLLAEHIAPLDENAFSSGMWSTGEDDDYGYGQYVNGTEFRIGFVDWETPGTAFILEDQTRNIFHHDKEAQDSPRITPVTDTNITDNIMDQYMQDRLITVARNHIARQAAGGDPVLGSILAMHIQYAGGDIDEPLILEDIPFWQVGRNSSHGCYLGYKDGQRYRMSEYWDHDEDGNSYPERDITPVDEFSGYMGHF
jgi:hypothetical protein